MSNENKSDNAVFQYWQLMRLFY